MAPFLVGKMESPALHQQPSMFPQLHGKSIQDVYRPTLPTECVADEVWCSPLPVLT